MKIFLDKISRSRYSSLTDWSVTFHQLTGSSCKVNGKGENHETFEGVKVIDFTSSISGPYCGALLADYGAEVYKLERPGRGEDSRLFPPQKDGVPLGFVSINRAKKGLSIDLNKPEGQELFRKLAAKVDVILENYTPGTMKRWNIDYETIKAVNPKIVYCSISGFGQFGPLSPLPGYDAVIQAMSGMMMSTGFPDGAPPERVTPPWITFPGPSGPSES